MRRLYSHFMCVRVGALCGGMYVPSSPSAGMLRYGLHNGVPRSFTLCVRAVRRLFVLFSIRSRRGVSRHGGRAGSCQCQACYIISTPGV